MHIFKHFVTITRHRHMVLKYCFKCGLYKQGLLHDLSKYGPTEFINGARYYAGIKSPHFNERNAKGYSEAWMHHKGRNKHHSEYWYDFSPVSMTYVAVPMPDRYIGEMFCDRLAASKNYNRGHYNRNIPLEYYQKESSKGGQIMHPETRKKLEMLLNLYVAEGEKAVFQYIKKNMRKKPKFPVTIE